MRETSQQTTRWSEDGRPPGTLSLCTSVALCLASLRASAWHGRGSNRPVAPRQPARRAGSELHGSERAAHQEGTHVSTALRRGLRRVPVGRRQPQGSESQPAPRRRTSGVPPAYLRRTSDVSQAYLRRTSHSRATRTSNICFLDNRAGTLVKLRTSRTSHTTHNAYLTRTSDVPQAYLRRTSAVPQTYLGRGLGGAWRLDMLAPKCRRSF